MILVDNPTKYPEHMVSKEAIQRGHVKKAWSHMTSDSSADELHQFAQRLRLRRAWFQGDHYDLTEGKQRLALTLGAVEVDSKELFRRSCFRKRAS